MPIYLQERQIPIWRFSPNHSAEENVKAALTKMANYRQAKMDITSLENYTEYFKDLDLRAFQVAMAVIAETRPREGETLWPNIGYILDVMEEARERYTSPSRPELNTRPEIATPGQKALCERSARRA